MKKVKEWLEDSKHQFIVRERYGYTSRIRSVSRIKDDAFFYIGSYRCAVPFRILEFDEDCIHAKVRCPSSDTLSHRTLNCRIDDIELNDDGSAVISWEGVTEDGLTSISDTHDPDDIIMNIYTPLDI